MKPTITMLVGLAASGKSTYAQKIANDTDAIILSSDAIGGNYLETKQTKTIINRCSKSYIREQKNICVLAKM